MTPAPPASSIRNNNYSILLLLALIAVGLAGNYFRYPIFLNIDFLFGSVFAMLALQFFGLGRGAIAAAAIACYTYIIWNHPYAIVIMTAEVVVVGFLMARRKMGMVLADTLYWVIIGMPLVYIFYHVVMHVPPSNTYIVMTKQTINGIANALIARMVFTGCLLRSRTVQGAYNEVIYNLLAFFVLCPSLVLLAVSSRTDFAETDKNIKSSLTTTSKRLDQFINTWLSNRKSIIVTLANTAALRSTRQMQSDLEFAKMADLNFVRIGLLDKSATTIAYAPLIDELGASIIGISFADRPYVQVLKQTLKPMLSDAFMGRIGSPGSRVVMLAPVAVGDTFVGYVAGTLSLQQIAEQLAKSLAENNTIYSLLDKNGNIIVTNRTDQKVLSQLMRGKGTLKHLDKEISQWIPELSNNIPISEQWKKSYYITETSIGGIARWKLILEQPVAPFQKKLYDNYTGKLMLLLVILLTSLGIAEIVSRRSIALLQESEERFRSMFYNHSAIMLLIDPSSGKIIDVNLAAEQFYGYPRTQLLAMNISDINQLSLEQLQSEQTLALERQSSYFIFSHRLANGETRTVEVHSTPITISDTKLLFSIVHDISKRRQAEEELSQAKDLAESATLAKSRFLSIAAHEFHTPLHLLTISMDILEQYEGRLSAEEQFEQHTQIRNAARQLSSLIDSVSVYNRQESDGNSAVPQQLDISQICATIFDEVSKVWCQDHTFRADISSDCGTGMFDDVLFRRLLENLLTNAYRFTPAGGSVSLSVKRHADRLLIEVADTGIGIPEEDQERIFDAFYRSSNVDARRGLGLGLSIVKDALQTLHGSISLKSKAGQGATFLVELPVISPSVREELLL